MPSVFRETRTIRREFIKWEGGKRVKTKPDEFATIELEINIDGLFSSVGARAAASRGGKSVIGSGLVTAKRRKV